MKPITLCALIGASGLLLTACNDRNPAFNQLPGFIQGDVLQHDYDGITDDLLTAGLGADGLASATAPAFADPLNPTARERRRLAIYNNYRALVDTAPGGGYGELFGPHVGVTGDGQVPGEEFLALMSVPGSPVPVTVMVQVPDSFNVDAPCMVTAPSSGSRGVYGAIGTAGEWGLKKQCAVVYTDKGTGTGAHNLTNNQAQTLDGDLTDQGVPVLFRAQLTDTQRDDFNAQWPDRFAWKHAHSRANPEADWGRHVLQSVEFGFYVLNEKFGRLLPNGKRLKTIKPDNTLVIASSVSNGGGASILAAEQDQQGLIDGVAVSEPNVNPVVDRSFSIRQGEGPEITEHSRSLLDYTTALAVYQGCANQAPAIRDLAPLNSAFNPPAIGQNICQSLANKGLVSGATVDDQATDALRILNEEFAIQPEQNLLAPLHFGLAVAQSISMTYANAYSRSGVEDRICDLSLAATDGSGAVIPLAPAAEAALFSASNGIPPSAGVNIVYDQAEGQPTNLAASVSPSSSLPDYGLDALLCLRALAQGAHPETGAELTGDAAALSDAVASGIAEVRATGNLRGKPAVFVTGRADAILPINHTSRPYVGLNRQVEGSGSGLRYYEILNAHHLDVLNGFPGVGDRYVPLHHYYFQALDLMWAHLTEGQPLPPSQVVRAVPRGDLANPLTQANLPPVLPAPADADRIIHTGSQLRIPD
ncbi:MULTISPECIES: 3-hydroxybutyrate oligomer hydrolase family protein [unclassified Marinobacter]|uniref:3-hydroxybutyrate oligomer hydrolase family protein n=1 Tax=unclassified Marinobacter TaxID=83889 RepID=UPI00126802E3|nr:MULTISPECIES: 3-hydroxybutyrate oligomer hydrolase family protein [unclassified Marinobacter]QFS85295.1 D-(-)-3-hydroxybutyrate oligomer hydrolase [Marinobacter sp. THAF197a]QFT49089.1 D-(-)-3-hydroxybutyrate oligomer hydrolase [Marinobacter sp. THAF39]